MNWIVNKPEKITVYWVWPYRFDSIVYTGQKRSLFKTDTGSGYAEMMTHLNDVRNNGGDGIETTEGSGLYNLNNSIGSFTYITEEQLNTLKGQSIDRSMSNKAMTLWNQGYNRADQIIGSNVAYIIWNIEAEETTIEP